MAKALFEAGAAVDCAPALSMLPLPPTPPLPSTGCVVATRELPGARAPTQHARALVTTHARTHGRTAGRGGRANGRVRGGQGVAIGQAAAQHARRALIQQGA